MTPFGAWAADRYPVTPSSLRTEGHVLPSSGDSAANVPPPTDRFFPSMETSRIDPLASRSAAAFWPTLIPEKGVSSSSQESPKSFEVSIGIGSGPRRNVSTAPSERGTTAGWSPFFAVFLISAAATVQVFPPSRLVTSLSSRWPSPSHARTVVPSFATNAEQGWLIRRGSSRERRIFGFDHVAPLSSEMRTQSDASSHPLSDWVKKW